MQITYAYKMLQVSTVAKKYYYGEIVVKTKMIPAKSI